MGKQGWENKDGKTRMGKGFSCLFHVINNPIYLYSSNNLNKSYVAWFYVRKVYRSLGSMKGKYIGRLVLCQESIGRLVL